MKKIGYFLVCFLFVIGIANADAKVKNPNTFILADIGSVDSLDPAFFGGHHFIGPWRGQAQFCMALVRGQFCPLHEAF